MKKTVVLIVFMLFANINTLLGQITKSDTLASKKDAGTSAVSNIPGNKKANVKALKQAAQKIQADSLANIKALKLVIEKSKKDSIALSKSPNPQKAASNLNNKVGPDTSHTVKSAPHVNNETIKADTVAQLKSNAGKKDNKKLNGKKTSTDSLSVKSKEKPLKGKSAKELKREAKKNDVNNLSQKDLANMAFKQIGSDTAVRSSATKHADISFTNARPLVLAEATTNNIKFYHRYWRDIDLSDPKNKRFSSYHADLILALLTAIKNKEIKAYNPAAISPENPTGDAFTVAIPYTDLMSGLSDTSVVNIMDKDGNVTGTKTVPNPFTPEKISGYRIKEDVYYDRIRSKTITRIIGIAPLVKLTLSSGEVLGIQPLCWLRFKDCRKVMVTIDVDPTKKIGDSMDDVFLQRRFYGKIVQESNPEGKRIKDYKTELIDQEVEAKRIEQKVIAYKKGSWNYTMLTESPAQLVNANKTIAKAKPAVKTKKEKITPATPQ